MFDITVSKKVVKCFFNKKLFDNGKLLDEGGSMFITQVR